jgi:hypothetical protein
MRHLFRIAATIVGLWWVCLWFVVPATAHVSASAERTALMHSAV